MSTETTTDGASEATALTPAAPAPPPPAVGGTHALVLRSLQDYLEFGRLCCESGLALGHKNAASVTIAVQFGTELGLSPMQSLRNVHIIQGRPLLSADALVAVAQAHPSCKFFRKLEESATKATWETHRRGHPEPTRYTFTIEDAKRAKLTNKDNWQGYTPRMLSARAKAFLARDVYPDRLAGILTLEEAEDVEDLNAAPGLVIATMPERASRTTEPAPDAPERAREGEPTISEPQRKRLYAIWKQGGHDDETVRAWLLAAYGIEHSKDTPKRLYDAICKRLGDATPLDVPAVEAEVEIDGAPDDGIEFPTDDDA